MTLKLTAAEARALGLKKPRKKRSPNGTRHKPAKYKEPTTPPYFFFEAACAQHGLPEPKREFLFHPTRKWKFDFAWITPWTVNGAENKIALEVDGGAWTQGRHTRGQGFIDDMSKSNEAILLGWKLLRCTPEQITSGEIFSTLKRAMTTT